MKDFSYKSGFLNIGVIDSGDQIILSYEELSPVCYAV